MYDAEQLSAEGNMLDRLSDSEELTVSVIWVHPKEFYDMIGWEVFRAHGQRSSMKELQNAVLLVLVPVSHFLWTVLWCFHFSPFRRGPC